MRIEYGKLSLQGHRKDNQDRVGIAVAETAAMLLTFDGMGGHSDGARAAEVALATVEALFREVPKPIFDPQGFLYMALGRAHDDVVRDGESIHVDERPRATCAICLIQDKAAYWAHVGDSRVYLLRNARVHERTRDHSHVEVLLQEGVIQEHQIAAHPMRNYVESCLGGDAPLPGITVSRKRPLKTGDVLLACTDGVWSGMSDRDLARRISQTDRPVLDNLRDTLEQAVRSNAPYSDNTTAAALRWLG